MSKQESYGNTIYEPLGRLDVRERIEAAGAPAASDRDLLAAILGSGARNKDVHSLAGEILDRFSLCTIPTVSELRKLNGLGMAGSCRVIAALELGRRFFGYREQHINGPEAIWQLLKHYADRKREHFLCCTLNGAHDLIGVHVITSGLINRTIIHPREIFAEAVSDRSCGLIIAHNHPSGRLEASPEDLDITRRIQEAGDILGIPLLDHLIFSAAGYLSMVEAGLMSGKAR